MSETSFEVPPEDAAEQDREVYPDDERVEPSDSLEVPEADAAEQARVVPAAEDDYR